MTFKEDGKSLQIYVSGRTQILGSELWVEERQSPSSINKNQNFILLQFMETSFLIFLCKTTACLPGHTTVDIDGRGSAKTTTC